MKMITALLTHWEAALCCRLDGDENIFALVEILTEHFLVIVDNKFEWFPPSHFTVRAE